MLCAKNEPGWLQGSSFENIYPSWLPKGNGSTIKKITTFFEEATRKKREDKTKIALFDAGLNNSAAINNLMSRAHIENNYRGTAVTLMKVAMCIALLSLIPIPGVRHLGMFAGGACAASVMQAAPYCPQYDISMIEKAYEESLSITVK